MNNPDILIYDKTYPYLEQSLKICRDSNRFLRLALRDYLRVLLPLGLRPGKRLLDVGSNIGTLGHLFKYSGVKTVGVDLNIDAIRAGRELYGKEHRNFSLHADARALPFREDSFDAVVSQDMFEHLPNTDTATLVFREMYRVLKPGNSRMYHKITVLEDSRNIDNDRSHLIKWPTEQWSDFFRSKGWNILGNPTRRFPVMSNTSYGNFLIQRSA